MRDEIQRRVSPKKPVELVKLFAGRQAYRDLPAIPRSVG
jgi:hypothetical protein